MAKGIKQLYGYPLIDQTARNDIKNNYQKKTDDTLTTTNKTIVGSINEVKNTIDNIGDNFTSEQTDTKYDMKYNGKSIANIGLELEEDQIAGGDGSFNIDLTPYQTKTDTSLTTSNKTISGAINEVNTQCKDIVNNKADKNDLQVQKTRIDNLATLKAGSTTGDAELIDARVGADGKTYTNLGNAIRGQFNELNHTTQHYYEKVQEFDQNKFSCWTGYTLVKEDDGTLTFSYTNNQTSTNYPTVIMNFDKNLIEGHDYYVAMDIKLKSCSETLLNNNNVTLGMFCIIGDGSTTKQLSTDIKKQMKYSLNSITTVKSVMQFTNSKSYSYTTTHMMISFLNNGLPVGNSIETSILNLCLVDLTASKLSYEEMDALFTAHKYNNISNSYFDITVSNAKQAETLKDFDKNNYVLKSELNADKQVKIVCCGDSLTMGAGWEDHSPDNIKRGYPEFIQEFTGIDTINTGIGGDKCNEIFARLGSEPIVINNITIPKDTTPVNLGCPLTTILGREFKSDIKYNATVEYKINPVIINGVEGTITQPDGIGTNYYFTRKQAGEQIVINRPTIVVTTQMQSLRNPDDIYVFYVGQNGGYDDVDDWIQQLKVGVDYIGCDKYLIIVCKTDYHNTSWDDTYNKFKKEFKSKFVDIRSYMIQYGLEDNGLTPTSDDTTAIAKGIIPPSLKKTGDNVHFNYYGYKTVGKIVSQRLKELYPTYFN